MADIVIGNRALEGIWGAVLLAADAGGRIDWTATEETLGILCESGLHGVYTNGTAGEFHVQTEAEFDRLSETAAAAARRAGVPFQLGVCHSNPRVSRERLRRVAALAPDGVQIVLPDWWPPTLQDAVRFVSGMAETAGGIPLILYNPPHAKRTLTLAEIAALKRAAPSLIGAKLAGGDAAWFAEMRERLPDVAVFIPGHFMATGCRDGGRGSYSNVACLSPRGALRWWKQFHTDREGALAFEPRVVAFIDHHMIPLRDREGLSNVGLDKAMAAAGGWSPVTQRLLWPYASASEEAVKAIAAAARRELPELFEE
jgi:dihydrodipicolinate synthase/N-acetylneuraminate lyase